MSVSFGLEKKMKQPLVDDRIGGHEHAHTPHTHTHILATHTHTHTMLSLVAQTTSQMINLPSSTFQTIVERTKSTLQACNFSCKYDLKIA